MYSITQALIATLMRELKISYTSEILTISLHTLVLVYDHSHLGLQNQTYRYAPYTWCTYTYSS